MIVNIAPLIVSAILLCVVAIPVIDSMEDDVSEEYTVILISGQSNAMFAGYANDKFLVDQDVPIIPSDVAYYYGTPTGVMYGTNNWSTQLPTWSIQPMSKGSTWNIGGYEAPLARAWYENTHSKCIIINTGWGSKSITWSTPGNEQYAMTCAVLDQLIEQVGADKLKWGPMFWIQGEADKNMAVSEYKTKFYQMWNSYKEYGFTDVYISLMPEKWGNSRIAQEELIGHDDIKLGSDIANTFTVEDGTYNTDLVHYTQKGRLLIADQFAEAMSYPSSESNQAIVWKIIGIVPIILIAAWIVYAVRSRME